MPKEKPNLRKSLSQNSWVLILSFLSLSLCCSQDLRNNKGDGLITKAMVIYELDNGVTDMIHNYGIFEVSGYENVLITDSTKILLVVHRDTLPLIINQFSKNLYIEDGNLIIKYITCSNFSSVSNYFRQTEKIIESNITIIIKNKDSIFSAKPSPIYYVQKLLQPDNYIIDLNSDSSKLLKLDYHFEPVGKKFIFKSKSELYDFIEIKEPEKPKY